MSNYESQDVPQRRYSVVCTSAVAVAVISGSFALVAMLVAPPQAFGLALVLCGAAWIVVHLVEQRAEHRNHDVRQRPRTPVRQVLVLR